jgi:hypothetical protein
VDVWRPVTPAISAVENPAAVQHDGLEEAVLLEVGHELAELGVVHGRGEGGGGVEVEVGPGERAAVRGDVHSPHDPRGRLRILAVVSRDSDQANEDDRLDDEYADL